MLQDLKMGIRLGQAFGMFGPLCVFPGLTVLRTIEADDGFLQARGRQAIGFSRTDGSDMTRESVAQALDSNINNGKVKSCSQI